ncbi:MAG: long-chain fatty acid--CoA ligase [Myxococcaceae bacterium]
MNHETCVERFFKRAKAHPNANAYFTKKEGSYKPSTWGEVGKQVESFAKGLIALGLREGQTVAILSYNRPEWLIAALAAQATHGVCAGVYNSCSAEEIAHILGHCEAPFIVVENGKRFREQIKPVLHLLPALSKVILMEPDDIENSEQLMTFSQVMEKGSKVTSKILSERTSRIRPEGIATLIYTSGTTGPAKAVMLSHRSIYWTVSTCVKMFELTDKDRMISYLPLAHIAEQMFSLYAPICTGMQLYFAESMEQLPENLKEVRPTLFFGVPRVYEKFHAKILPKLKSAKGLKAKLLNFSEKSAQTYWNYEHRNLPVPAMTKAKMSLARKLVFSKLKDLLGFSEVRACVSGAAPLSKDIISFFTGLDLPIYEVYGQSEDCGPTTFSAPRAMRLGTVGKPLPGLQIKIEKDGEVCIRGPNVFKGYLKDEAATAEALKDGWLHSGDIGHLDSEGYLCITDRKKDLLITAGGKNISPQNLEGMLKQIPFVNLAVVIGDQKKYLSALLTPNHENLKIFAEENKLTSESLADWVRHPQVLSEIQSHIDKINQTLASVEQIKKFTLLASDFSIENGELTPTMKIKRKVINTRYQEQIEALY